MEHFRNGFFIFVWMLTERWLLSGNDKSAKVSVQKFQEENDLDRTHIQIIYIEEFQSLDYFG